MSESKTTLPWITQEPAWGLFSAFAPWGENAFRETKPQMFEQLFPNTPDGWVQDQLGPYRRYTADYDPYSYLNDTYARPGGPSQGETNLLNNSY